MILTIPTAIHHQFAKRTHRWVREQIVNRERIGVSAFRQL
jgi:hypothetical protein